MNHAREVDSVTVGPFPVLTVGAYRMTFAARSSGRLPEWTGSAWRGAFGRALKQTVCLTGMRECPPCPLFDRCTHARIFETAPPAGQAKMRKYTAAPRPYVLLPDRGGGVERGERMEVEVRLFGQVNRHSELVLGALERAAWRGLGKSATSFELLERSDPDVRTLDASPGKDLPPPTGDLEFRLLTPLRLRIQNRYIGPHELNFGDFFSILLRRISMLCTFHQQQPFAADFRSLVASARAIAWADKDLRLVALKRFSSRQKNAIDMSGLVGRLSLSAASAAPYRPWLWLGQSTLLGRGCVMGLGHYRMQD